MKKMSFKKKMNQKMKVMAAKLEKAIKNNKGTTMMFALIILTIMAVAFLRTSPDTASAMKKVEAPVHQISNQVKNNIMQAKKGCVISEKVYTKVKKHNKQLQAQLMQLKKREKKLMADIKNLSKKGKKKSASNFQARKRA